MALHDWIAVEKLSKCRRNIYNKVSSFRRPNLLNCVEEHNELVEGHLCDFSPRESVTNHLRYRLSEPRPPSDLSTLFYFVISAFLRATLAMKSINVGSKFRVKKR